MSDIKMFIQYHQPLPEKYQGLYHILDDEKYDYYHFIRLNSNDVIEDDFLRNMEYSDNTGDNIADKNYHYVDLTALYWYWKNVECDIIGNDHYSKYVLDKGGFELIPDFDIEDYLDRYDFICHIATLPGTTVYEIFDSFHGHEFMDAAGEVIQDLTPEYYSDFEEVMNGYDATVYNMMICRKTDYDAYCSWLFPIIFECENRIEIPTDDFQRKILGCIAERLLLVWLKHNNKTYYGSMPMVDNIDNALYTLCGEKEAWQELAEVEDELHQTEEFAKENEDAIMELADLSSENEEAIFDLGEYIDEMEAYIQDLEERVAALEGKD